MAKKIAIQTKRAYEPASKSDGQRFLVDHLWPRGVKKEKLHVEDWLKEIAPSDALRKWFKHDPKKWDEFQKRYFAELNEHPASWKPLVKAFKPGETVTLVYGARDEEHNNAVALRTYLLKKL